MGSAEQAQDAVRLIAVARGSVQGVGFRYFTAREAERLRLAGTAVNRPDGAVEIIVEGPPEQVAELLAWLESARVPGTVTSLETRSGAATGTLHGFHTG
ncbi:MAG: acylphosphatase [Specibacter sp.]